MRSPSRSGISRKAPLKGPLNRNVMRSSTSSVPSGSTTTRTSAAGSENDFAAAGAAQASAASVGRDECRDARQNSTRGASRAAVSISKNSRGPNPNVLATRFVGTVSRAFSYVSTVSL